MVDTEDLKSFGSQISCGFKSRPRHQSPTPLNSGGGLCDGGGREVALSTNIALTQRSRCEP
jgi:hypothetical protein